MCLAVQLLLIIPVSFVALLLYISAPKRSIKFLSVVIAIWAFGPLLAATGLAATGHASADDTQFYADDCGLPNDGVNDDAAPLRSCMEAMPSGATMNLDGSKPYYFSTYGSSDLLWGPQQCELYLRSNQTLNLNGASLTDTAAVEAAGATFICAGSPNFNYPGSVSGVGTPVFYNINPTAQNATQIVTANAADAANFSPGDDIYIDGGTQLLHLCIGWDEVSSVNPSTGVINLEYPLLKAYPGTSSTCAGLTPRIYDWSTGNGAYNLGPLAHNVTIENGTITQVSTSSSIGPIILEGSVHPIVRNLNLHNVTNGGSGAIFGNNNHLGIFNNIKVDGYGCTQDFTLFPGGFTSSLNLVENSVVKSSGNPGVGCGSGNSEIAYGDEEGGEGNVFKNDTATMLPGNTSNEANPISCALENRSWGDLYNGLTCNSPAGEGFADQCVGTGPCLRAQVATGEIGPTVVKNSQISCFNGCLVGGAPGDQFVNNTSVGIGNGGSLNVYLPTSAVSVTGNTIIQNATGRTYALYIGNADASYGSDIENNTLSCQPSRRGNCLNGLYIALPSGESSSTQPLTIIDNQITGFENDYVYPGAVVFPDATISGNPGLPDQ
jgi:hypothetical protein